MQSNTIRSSITNPALGATFISFPDLATMAKKKAAGGAAVNKAAAKAAKKAKAAAKVERKEKKKVGKGRDEEDVFVGRAPARSGSGSSKGARRR